MRSGMIPAGSLRSLEICAGVGGLALGLETAGFHPVGLVEKDVRTCEALRLNRPGWNVVQMDANEFDPDEIPVTYDVDLLVAGLPRLRADSGSQEEADEERALVNCAVCLVGPVRPRAVVIENLPKLADGADFAADREEIGKELEHLGFRLHWRVLNAKDFGVPQDREHGFLVALREDVADDFRWPSPLGGEARTVGEALHPSMVERRWPYADIWRDHARRPAPLLVGGSRLHGGPDLGPSRTKKIWQRLGINGKVVADAGPECPSRVDTTKWDLADKGWDLEGSEKGMPALTLAQVALLQGFPADWVLPQGKTNAYAQLAQAVPPALAAAVGRQVFEALS
ncbi:DNA cytosine methyltransferase [Streptomyces sp. NPDC002812]|uniref:DNA cytosine methyltransferase n=1 Tax=Streptomyces sp. NPDC002812 TaxID=3154434 RepID=UPI0033197493